jgi:hypothetical protein
LPTSVNLLVVVVLWLLASRLPRRERRGLLLLLLLIRPRPPWLQVVPTVPITFAELAMASIAGCAPAVSTNTAVAR